MLSRSRTGFRCHPRSSTNWTSEAPPIRCSLGATVSTAKSQAIREEREPAGWGASSASRRSWAGQRGCADADQSRWRAKRRRGLRAARRRDPSRQAPGPPQSLVPAARVAEAWPATLGLEDEAGSPSGSPPAEGRYRSPRLRRRRWKRLAPCRSCRGGWSRPADTFVLGISQHCRRWPHGTSSERKDLSNPTFRELSKSDQSRPRGDRPGAHLHGRAGLLWGARCAGAP